jgi:hypothetical protein
MPATDLLEKSIAAHGGSERWQSLQAINASLSSGGLAFTSHLQPFALRNLKLSLLPHSREATLHGYGRPGWCGKWTPGHVRMLDENGSLVAERHDPRASFAKFRKNFQWDKLDMLYFAGYALWNYLSFPFILKSPGVGIEEAVNAGVAHLHRLDAHFDETIPTHSPVQSFYLDESGILKRHDYTADVIGSWAKAANLCLASEQVEGMRFYTRRRVYPTMGHRLVLPLPTLVWIEIDDIRLDWADGNARPA